MKKIILSLLALFALVATVPAQSNTGRLVGIVVSADGSVPGATVTITDRNTNKDRTTTSSADGAFTLPQLEVGNYTVKVTAPGFKTFTADGVKIDVGREYTLTATLEVGAVEETVTITAGNDVVNATTAELSGTISNKQILELPLNGRNPLDLLSLQAGVSQNGAQNSSINGMRTSFTNITRDGLNVQDGFIRSNATDFAPNRPSVDDTGEFTVVTQNAGADQNGGAQVRLVTPCGGSQFHGALFAFNRNSALAANNFFNNRSGLGIPFLNRNNFGGRLSGPLPLPRFGQGGPSLVKDKAFFFFGYEGLRTRESSFRNRTILLPGARQGVFTYRDSANALRTVNILSLAPANANLNGIDSTVNSRILSKLPAAGNNTDLGDQLNTTGYSFNQRANSDRNTYTTRLDYDLSERHTLNGAYSFNSDANMRPDVDGANGFGATPVVGIGARNKFLALAWRWTPGARFTNEARGGFFNNDVPFARSTAKPDFFIAPTLVSNPEVTFLDQGRRTRYYNFQDNAEWSLGNHALYVQDQWRVRPSLTLNLGLRRLWLSSISKVR